MLYNISLLQSLLLKLAIFKILFRKLHLFETAFSPCHTHLLATKSSYLFKKCSMICSVQVLRKEKEIQEMVTSETKNPYAVIRNDHRKYLSNIEKQTSLKMFQVICTLFRKKNGDYWGLEGFVIPVHTEQITRETIALKCGFTYLNPRIYWPPSYHLHWMNRQ